jgi:hypothetical protein
MLKNEANRERERLKGPKTIHLKWLGNRKEQQMLSATHESDKRIEAADKALYGLAQIRMR